ncbi:MAG: glycosyltransferase [Gammaproteobacteria bacterium]
MKKRILRVIDTLNPRQGGPVNNALRIDELLIRRGYSITVLTSDSPNAEYLGIHPGTVVAAGSGKGGYGFSRRMTHWLEKNSSDFDAVIVNGIWTFHSLAARNACIKAGVPYYLYLHGMLDPWFKHQYPAKHLKKLIYWLFFERRVLRDAEAVIFTSKEEMKLAPQSFPFYQVRGVVGTYGAAVPSFSQENLKASLYNAHPDLKSRKILLFLGRIHPKKGCDLLLQAFSQVAHLSDDYVIVMVGPDEVGWRSTLQAKAVELGIHQRVRWFDMVTGEDKWRLYAAADLFCLPSHQENFGIVVAEALAMGLPTLITDKVNIWQEILDDGAGLVCEDNSNSLADALEKWITGISEEQKEVMKSRATACYRTRFSIDSVVDSVESIISGAAHKKFE